MYCETIFDNDFLLVCKITALLCLRSRLIVCSITVQNTLGALMNTLMHIVLDLYEALPDSICKNMKNNAKNLSFQQIQRLLLLFLYGKRDPHAMDFYWTHLHHMHNIN